jgi:two-component system chemotaxis response regulator CheY
MRNILRKIMQGIGFEVIEACNGQEALERLAEHADKLSLALVDWNMPVMDGYEFVSAVRQDPAHTNLKLVMVTTETEPARMVKALMAGVDEFVMKPFTTDILVEKLKLIGVSVPDISQV